MTVCTHPSLFLHASIVPDYYRRGPIVQATMVDWLEFGREVTHLIAAKYRDDDSTSKGITFTRKLCPVTLSLRFDTFSGMLD
jgi:hypothetical protein